MLNFNDSKKKKQKIRCTFYSADLKIKTIFGKTFLVADLGL